MKFKTVMKMALIPTIILASIFSTLNSALADYLAQEGYGGRYKFELWGTNDNTYYYLKIWQQQDDKQTTSPMTTQAFTSTQEALNYFDCHYGEKSLPECPKR